MTSRLPTSSPGDLAVVTSGETFPADGIIIDGADIQADESSLTGESYAVRKRLHPEPPRGAEEPIAYVRAFAAGHLEHGRAMALAVLTPSSATVTAVLSRMRTSAARIVVLGTAALSILLIQTTPATVESAMRLLEPPLTPASRGNMVATGATEEANSLR